MRVCVYYADKSNLQLKLTFSEPEVGDFEVGEREVGEREVGEQEVNALPL